MRALHAIALATSLLSYRAHAKPKSESLADGSVTGSIVAIDEAGRWRALAETRVTLSCPRSEPPSDENQWQNRCEARVVAERNGKIIARQKSDTLGIDFRAVGGNRGSLELALLDLGEVSLVLVRQTSREGDEASKESATEQLLAIAGGELREIYRHESLTATEPGPDGSGERERTTETLTVAKGSTLSTPSLVVTTQTLAGKPERAILIWDGKRFVDKPVVLPVPARLIDPASGKSIEAQLAKVLGGGLLSPVDLHGLSPAALGLLRNALYARHGRPFKKPELQAFFYSPRPIDRQTLTLPRQVNPAFTEALLDATDRANLKTLLKPR